MSHEMKPILDDITWHELDMDLIVKQIDSCQTKIGHQYFLNLLKGLKCACTEQEISYFSNNALVCQQAEKLLGEIGNYGKAGYNGKKLDTGELENEYLQKKEIARDIKRKEYFMYAFYFLSIFLFLWKPLVCFAVVSFVVVYQVLTYFQRRKQLLESLQWAAQLLRMIKRSDKWMEFASDNELLAFEEADCNKLKKLLRHSFWIMQSGRIDGSPLGVICDYARMLFQFDLLELISFWERVEPLSDEIEKLFDCVGRIDSLICIAKYRKKLGNWCVPSDWFNDAAREQIEQKEKTEQSEHFNQSGQLKNQLKLIVADGYHPLVEKPVYNSCNISLDKGMLITGSNASGKTTFLKMLAVNLVFSQTIHTVLAKEWYAPKCLVYTAMNASDSIQNGESRYVAEIKAIKRIMDIPDGEYAICFLDEILRGTNTVERIAASAKILEVLIGKRIACFAATHDRELIGLLADCYEKYYFTEELKDGKIYFSYKLLQGSNESQNAIRLLSTLGFDKELVEGASILASNFRKEGKWI